MVGIEYLTPRDQDRDIDTLNLDLNYLLAQQQALRFSVYLGLTLSQAEGNIIQLERDPNNNLLTQVRYETLAFGLGPGVLISVQLLQANRFVLHLDGGGSLLFYNKRFPPGGERYNFIWRAGPRLEYRLGEAAAVGVQYRWAHISNGQGAGAQNPSYDARGAGLVLSGRF